MSDITPEEYENALEIVKEKEIEILTYVLTRINTSTTNLSTSIDSVTDFVATLPEASLHTSAARGMLQQLVNQFNGACSQMTYLKATVEQSLSQYQS